MVQARLATGKGYHSSTNLRFQPSKTLEFLAESNYDDRVVIAVPPKKKALLRTKCNVSAEGELNLRDQGKGDDFYARDNAHTTVVHFPVPAFAGA